MHSKTFTALARWADDQGCDIVAMHELPGAMQHADGVYVVLYTPSANRYCVVSLHVNPKAPVYPEDTSALTTNREDAIQASISDLYCGDRHWHTHAETMQTFHELVRLDSQDL